VDPAIPVVSALADGQIDIERFQPDWKRSSSYFASNFIGPGPLRDSGQADSALVNVGADHSPR
jgi:hypothetical protein